MGCCYWGYPHRHWCGAPPPWWYEESRGVAPPPPPPRVRRSRDELEDYLEYLEEELRRVREEMKEPTRE